MMRRTVLSLVVLVVAFLLVGVAPQVAAGPANAPGAVYVELYCDWYPLDGVPERYFEGYVTIDEETSHNSDAWTTIFAFDRQRQIEHGTPLSRCLDHATFSDSANVWTEYWDTGPDPDVSQRVDADVYVRVIPEFPPA